MLTRGLKDPKAGTTQIVIGLTNEEAAVLANGEKVCTVETKGVKVVVFIHGDSDDDLDEEFLRIIATITGEPT